MTDQDETQRIESVEPTRRLDPEPSARPDLPSSAPPQPYAGRPVTQPAAAGGQGVPQHPAASLSGSSATPAAPMGQQWAPPPLGQSGLGQPPAGAPGWVVQQPSWPGAYAPTPSAPGTGVPYGAPAATGAAYGQPGYSSYAGYAAPGYPQPGYGPYAYDQPGQAQSGQNQQPAYGTAYGPYARYAQPGQVGYAQQPYNPYASQYQSGQQYQPGQQWPPPAPQRPRRRTGRVILVVALALALSITGFAWALSPMLEQSLSPTTPSAEQVEPDQPTTAPDTDTDTDTDSDSESSTGGTGTASESVGVVFVEGETSSGIAAGTGMVLTADGTVLTNYHVVAGTYSLEVTIADSGDTYTATVLGFDQSKDVALLQLADASGLDTVTIDDDEVSVGDEVAAVGNAGGEGVLVRAAGEVVGLDRSLTVSSDSPWGSEEDLSGVIETTAGAVPGHSGGPMFDDEGEVLGITTAGSTEAERSYAVPIADALEVVDTIEAGRDAGTVRVGPAGYMGIVIGNASRYGVTITDVVSGSPADEAGIEVGSTLVQIGDTRVSETTNLATVIRALEPDDEVTVEWLTPRGESRSASITLTASPVN